MLVKFNLSMMHGGWNSDDNQSLNLGRYSSRTRRRKTSAPTRYPLVSGRS